jgi:disulfide bond formation protein DsbB
MSPFPVVIALSVLTVAGQLLSVALIALLLLRRPHSPIGEWVSSHGLLLMFVVALTATVGSLFFSDIAGWTPCKLCWFQRIFMYPQVFLLGLAIWMKDRGIARYIILLSVIGLLIATFHYGEQVIAALNPVTIDPNVPCDTSGTSCRSTPFFNFGYITIPMMALTAFLMNIVGSLFVLRPQKTQL